MMKNMNNEIEKLEEKYKSLIYDLEKTEADLIEKESIILSLEGRLDILEPPNLDPFGLPSDWDDLREQEIRYEASSPRDLNAETLEEYNSRVLESEEVVENEFQGFEELENVLESDRAEMPKSIFYEPQDYDKTETAPLEVHEIGEESGLPVDSFNDNEYPLSVQGNLNYIPYQDLNEPQSTHEELLARNENHRISHIQSLEQEISADETLLNLDQNQFIAINTDSDLLQNISEPKSPANVQNSFPIEPSLSETNNFPIENLEALSKSQETTQLKKPENEDQLEKPTSTDETTIKNTTSAEKTKNDLPKKFFKYQPKVIPKKFQPNKSKDDDFFEELKGQPKY
jgi:hypothetical protein